VDCKLSQDGLVLCYYGDDFTGSTDALEVLGLNGFSPVLFLNPPDDAQVARLPGCRAVGVAGTSRSRSPEWMSCALTPAFMRLKQLGAPICHYKVCSTFDSSPEVGSIGKALEIGQEVFAVPYVPVVVGVPAIGRYALFGHLFANFDGRIYRIDRHPTMRSHPVTPMTESDLALHLSRQTQKKIRLMDILSLQSPDLDERFTALQREGPEVILFDVLDESSLARVGRILWLHRPPGTSFIVGSSGVEYALMAHWRATGQLPPPPAFEQPRPVDRLVVVSGSCSPNTEIQIQWSLERGFVGIPIGAQALVSAETRISARDQLLKQALRELSEGHSIVLYTALASKDSARAREIAAAESSFGLTLGEQLGILLRELLLRSGVRRVAIAGGDTSSYIGRQLSIEALTMASPLVRGAPLCRAHSDEPTLDGLELIFKGGQVGAEDCFGRVREGQVYSA
jgi:uncharacterized protein YgbK (DUF1537 family)